MTSKGIKIDHSQVEGNKSSAARLVEMVGTLRRHGVIYGVSPEKLKLILEDLGPTYVKLGQIMSMRADMLPKEYCQVLAGLRTDVKTISYEDVVRVIETEQGAGVDEIFQEISKEPIGSGSIAQVHKAILKNEKTVVIKVQRPGIYQTMERDVHLLKKAISLMKILKISVGKIDFKMFIDEMWATAQQEMNFITEADYIQEFTDLNANINYIAFPQVERYLTTPRVLVMEYVEGVQIDELAQLEQLGYDINGIGLKLAENYIKQIVDDGLFHADPHPGNIYIRDGKIVWLDLGMVGRINNRDRMLLKKTILAIVQHDIEGLIEIFLVLDTIKGSFNRTKLYEDFEILLARHADMDFAGLHLGQIMEEVKDILVYHQISLPSGITMLGRGIVTIEGVLKVCSPQVNFVEVMANHIAGSILKGIDLKREILLTASSLRSFTKSTLALPEQLSNFLKVAMRGQTKINIDLSSANEPARRADRMINKLTIGILSSSLIIGSSIICASNVTPRLFGTPVLGITGYLIALLLSGWIIIKIIRNK
ncbi:MAG: AarF/UbiB family protein [Desulfotomaculaceae bacterium]|nr:AarF/UbiB family protein [Desulfotomaculaceae bacterium]